MSKSHDYAWAAGFIDGDGWMRIEKRSCGGHYARIGACQVQKRPLDKLQELFGGKIAIKSLAGRNRKDNFNRKQQYLWTCSTKQAVECLTKIRPYLIHKSEVADCILEFYQTIDSTRKVRVTEEIYSKRCELADKCKYINSLD